MDGRRFDLLAQRLDRAVNRRSGLRGVVAGLLVGLAGPYAGATKSKRQPGMGSRFSAQGPCGDGGPRANGCTRDKQCCTRYCHKPSRRCRCRQQGQRCTQDRNCCRQEGQQLSCRQRRCQPPRPPMPTCGNGGPCRVFVTSSQQTGGDLNGLAGADALCQGLAAGAGLPGTYKAWLSDDTESPATRFTNRNSTGPYVLVDEDATEIAADWAALTNGTLDAPIDVTETREDVRPLDAVWTYTRANGAAVSVDFSPQPNCSNWMDGSDDVIGVFGLTNLTNSVWTRGPATFCDGLHRLYCFQQG